MVCIYFIVIDCIFFVYMFFNECMVGFWFNGCIICICYDIFCILVYVRVINDFIVGVFFDKGFSK